jgi:hypothetical protein|tara:strand:- start:338 stop:658 length:321 start_codon:yes stop_codon:yes gene_type:complete
MSYFREEIFDILFTEWNTVDTKVKLSSPVVMIIETHFGSDGDIVLPLAELIQLYHLARRDLTDYVELSDRELPIEEIQTEVDNLLKQVLGLDALTRHHIRDSLNGS